jgi:hypothetical protein
MGCTIHCGFRAFRKTQILLYSFGLYRQEAQVLQGLLLYCRVKSYNKKYTLMKKTEQTFNPGLGKAGRNITVTADGNIFSAQ